MSEHNDNPKTPSKAESFAETNRAIVAKCAEYSARLGFSPTDKFAVDRVADLVGMRDKIGNAQVLARIRNRDRFGDTTSLALSALAACELGLKVGIGASSEHKINILEARIRQLAEELGVGMDVVSVIVRRPAGLGPDTMRHMPQGYWWFVDS